MKLAIVTSKELHHKYFILELCKEFDVALIIQPTGIKNIGFFKKIKQKNFFMYGFFWFLLKMLSLIYNKISGKSMTAGIKRNEKKFFGYVEGEFNKIAANKVLSVETVNNPEVIALVRKNEIDIICFLGGDIAEQEFIDSAKICSLNYHSGISPFYNGNKTIFHAVKDYRPNFAGGTLMYITERIDGGGILSHYLPEINETDTAASLFMKGIQGAVLLYRNFLNYIKSNELPKGVVQQRAFKYVRNIDWTLVDDLKLRKFEGEGKMKIYKRGQEVINYFDVSDNDLTKVYARSLNCILKKSK